jgi:putative FmdB family regulatory protein
VPTYEYQCKSCGRVFDVFQSIKAAPLKRSHCEDCGAVMPVRRLISTGGAVLFKGSGFYQTDYRSESYQKSAKAETPGGDGTKAGDNKSDAKPSKESATPKGSASEIPKPATKKSDPKAEA